MKTHLCKLLKKPVLVVELPDHTADFSVINTGDRIAISAFDEYDNCLEVKGIATNYTLLGKPDEIKEEDVRELVEKVMQAQHFQNYKARQENDFANLWCKTAKESLLSAIETKVYWENPYGAKESNTLIEGGHEMWAYSNEHFSKWNESQSRTFDRNRTLIFIQSPTQKI